METSLNYSQQFLEASLARLDLLLHRQLQRSIPTQGHNEETFLLDRYYISEEQAYALLFQRVGYSGVDGADQEAEEYNRALETVDAQITAIVDAAQTAGREIRFLQLAGEFCLDAFERDVLLVCLAPDIDVRYARLFGYLNNDPIQQFPSVDLVLNLLVPPGLERLTRLSYFAAESRLRRHHLIDWKEPEPPVSRLYPILSAYEGLASWLFGDYQPPVYIHKHLTYVTQPQADAYLLSEAQHQGVAEAAASEDIVVFWGSEQLAQRTAAQLLALLTDRPLLTLDLYYLAREQIALRKAIALTLRDARLTGAIAHFTNWQVCLDNGSPPPDILNDLCQHPGVLLIDGISSWLSSNVARSRRLRWLPFLPPDFTQRQQLLVQLIGAVAGDIGTVAGDGAKTHVCQNLAATDLAALAGQFTLKAEQWRDVVNTAADMASQTGEALDRDKLFAAAREHSNPRLTNLARKITPRYQWDDLILPQDQIEILREVVLTVRHRGLVLEEWELGQTLVSSMGIAMLFAGPPGTGKTMAAEVLARELALDLFKIDLSGVVSKYIGETEKNLEQIFSEAENSNAILFFDEADAIFGKRSEVSDAHDRHANIEVSYLLQRMESYNGITILATNLRANLDEAFTRRIQFAVDFPSPDVHDRLRIWQTLMPRQAPHEEDLDLSFMARSFKFSGGNIRNVLVGATYLAAADGGKISTEHLLHAARRELQKMGRIIQSSDFVYTREGER